MSTTLSLKVTANPLPANAATPTSFQGLLDLVTRYITISLDESVLPLQIAAKVALNPATSQVAITGDGALGNFFEGVYQGEFRPFYTGLPGQIELFSGRWLDHFDSTGLGLRHDLWDGWALCNGRNGTTDLGQRFVVPGYRMANGKWVTNVEAGVDELAGYGGSYGFTIQVNNLPALNFFIGGEDDMAVGEIKAMSFAGDPLNNATGTYPINGSSPWRPITAFPPWIALGYAQWVGYL